jgi:hypothetical protein
MEESDNRRMLFNGRKRVRIERVTWWKEESESLMSCLVDRGD